MNKISMDKQYRTRDGRPVRVLCVDAPGAFPVVAIVDNGVIQYSAEGRVGGCIDQYINLIEIKPRIKRRLYLNVYPTDSCVAYPTREQADNGALANRVACIPIDIDCEEGEGLEASNE